MGRDGAPAREISFVSLVSEGPKVSHSALATGGLQLLKPGRAVPNNNGQYPSRREVEMKNIVEEQSVYKFMRNW